MRKLADFSGRPEHCCVCASAFGMRLCSVRATASVRNAARHQCWYIQYVERTPTPSCSRPMARKTSTPSFLLPGSLTNKALQLAAQSPKLAVQVKSCQLSFVSTPTTPSKTCNLPSRSNSALNETGLCSGVGDKYVEQSLYDQVGGKIFAQNAQTSKISGSGWKRWALPCTAMKLKKDFDAAWVVT